MTKYALGFCFSPDARHVILISKNRPGFLVGLNGVGGRVEPEIDLSPLDTIRREFREETGVEVFDWREFAQIETPTPDESVRVQIHCFVAHHHDWHRCQTTTDEEVAAYVVAHLDLLREQLLPFVEWLVPLALDARLTAQISLTKNH